MKLSNSETEKFFEALLDAYPNYNQLKIMVKFKLGENLENLSENTDNQTVVFNLIEWAEKTDKLLNLILGAYERNPGNSKINEFTYQLLNRMIANQEIDIAADLKTQFYQVVNEFNILEKNPKQKDRKNNQQESNFDEDYIDFDESICHINFQKATQTFIDIQSQLNEDEVTILFFMEKNLIRQGDLYLKRLKNELKPVRGHFREFYATYTSGNSEGVVQKIGEYLNIKQEEMTINEYINLVIQKLGNSLQNNSVFFIEIKCDISDQSEIEPLIPWFITEFWQPLRKEINKITQNFSGIKVIAVIISKLEIYQRLSCHCNDDSNCFEPDKLVKIPLEDSWKQKDIYEWLKSYPTTGLTVQQRQDISTKIYKETDGRPRDVCFALQQEWETLIKVNTFS